MVLQLDNVDGLENLQPEWASHVPVVRRYTPAIERWRSEVESQMPDSLRRRKDAAQLVDKYLWTMSGENGAGDPTIFHDGGNGYGLMADRVSRTPPGTPPGQQIKNAWDLVAKNPTTWTDWGEGSSYQGKAFGALGVIAPYDPNPDAVFGGGAVQGGTYSAEPSDPTIGAANNATVLGGAYDPNETATEKLRRAREKRLAETGYIPGQDIFGAFGQAFAQEPTPEERQYRAVTGVQELLGPGIGDIPGKVRSVLGGSAGAVSDVFGALDEGLGKVGLGVEDLAPSGLPLLTPRNIKRGAEAALTDIPYADKVQDVAGDIGSIGGKVVLNSPAFGIPYQAAKAGAGALGLDVPSPGDIGRELGRGSVPNTYAEAGLQIATAGGAGEALTGLPIDEALRIGGRAVADTAARKVATSRLLSENLPESIFRHARAGANIAAEAAGLDPYLPKAAREARQAGQQAWQEYRAANPRAAAQADDLLAQMGRQAEGGTRQAGATAGLAYGPEVGGGSAVPRSLLGKTAAERRQGEAYRNEVLKTRTGERTVAMIDKNLAESGQTWADHAQAAAAFTPSTPSWERMPAAPNMRGRVNPNDPESLKASIRQAVQDVREARRVPNRDVVREAQVRARGAEAGTEFGPEVGGGAAVPGGGSYSDDVERLAFGGADEAVTSGARAGTVDTGSAVKRDLSHLDEAALQQGLKLSERGVAIAQDRVNNLQRSLEDGKTLLEHYGVEAGDLTPAERRVWSAPGAIEKALTDARAQVYREMSKSRTFSEELASRTASNTPPPPEVAPDEVATPMKTTWSITNAAGDTRTVETELPHGYADAEAQTPGGAMQRLEANTADQNALNDRIRSDERGAVARQAQEGVQQVREAARTPVDENAVRQQGAQAGLDFGSEVGGGRAGTPNFGSGNERRPSDRIKSRDATGEQALRQGPMMDPAMHELSQGLEADPKEISLRAKDVLLKERDAIRAGPATKKRSELGRNAAQLDIWAKIEGGANPAELVDAMSEAYMYKPSNTPYNRGYIAEMERIQSKLVDLSYGDTAINWNAVREKTGAVAGPARPIVTGSPWQTENPAGQAAGAARATTAPVPPPPTETPGGISVMDVVKGLGRELSSTPGAALSTVASYSPQIGRQGLAAFFMNPRRTLRNLATSLKAGVKEEEGLRILDAQLADDWIRSTADKKALAAERFTKGLGVAAEGEPIVAHEGYTWQDVGGTMLDWRGRAPLEGKSLAELKALAAQHDITLPANVTTARAAEQIARDLRPELLEGLSEETKVGRAAAKVTGPSSRQSATELNLYRTDWYKGTAQAMWDAGERDVEAYKSLRKTIEIFTQRGAWKQPFSVPAFFSTRAMSARVQMVERGLDAMIHFPDMFKPGARQEAGKALLALTAGNMTMLAGLYGAASAAGLSPRIETDGKLPTLTVGDHFHFDPWAGINTPARAAFGVIADTIANPEGGLENAPQAFVQSVNTRGQRILRGGLSPIFSKAAATATGRDFTGGKYSLVDDLKSGGLAKDLLAPMLATSTAEGYAEGGPVGAVATGVPSALSLSVNAYQTPTDSANESARQNYGRAYDDLNKEERIATILKAPADAQKTLVREEKSRFVEDRKQNGYMDYMTADEKRRYYEAHPEHELQAWAFEDRAFTSVDTADRALALGVDDPKHPIRYSGISRPLNASEDTKKAWADSKDIMQWYDKDLMAPDTLNATARRMYKDDYAKLSGEQQGNVRGNIHATALKADPEADAWMYWWGRIQKPNSNRATSYVENEIYPKYGYDADYFNTAQDEVARKLTGKDWDKLNAEEQQPVRTELEKRARNGDKRAKAFLDSISASKR